MESLRKLFNIRPRYWAVMISLLVFYLMASKLSLFLQIVLLAPLLVWFWMWIVDDSLEDEYRNANQTRRFLRLLVTIAIPFLTIALVAQYVS